MTDRARSLLIVDDDLVYRQRLALAMEKRGFAVRQAESVSAGISAAKSEAPDYAVVDLRLNDGSGLDIVTMPRAMRDQVPTSNFFQRRGYERNTVASRNNTVAKLLAVTDSRMDAAVQQPGARELAASF